MCLIGIIQLKRLQSHQRPVKVTLTRKVFVWRALLYLTTTKRFAHGEVFFLLVRSGRNHRWRQELRVYLQGLPARMYFKSHESECAFWQSRGGTTVTAHLSRGLSYTFSIMFPSSDFNNKVLPLSIFTQNIFFFCVGWKSRFHPEIVKEPP